MESLPNFFSWVLLLEPSSTCQSPLKKNKPYINQFKEKNLPRRDATNTAVSASFAAFDIEVCVFRGFEADFNLVAVDERGWAFSFVDEVFVAVFLAMAM